MEELWTPITLGAAKNAVWAEVAGLFWEDMNDDSTQPPPHLIRTTLLACLILGVLSGIWRIIPLYGFTKPARSAAERRSGRINIRGAEANIKAASRKFNGVRGVNDALIQLLHSPSPVYSRVIDSPAREAGWQVPGVSLLDPPTSTWPSMSLCLRLHCVYRRNAAKNVHPSASKI